jgi:FAS-associated factor 2
MSADEVDLDQLSESERSALEQYTSVTGQDLAEAIPLLRRSQWNVQVGRHTCPSSRRGSYLLTPTT